MQAFPFLHMSRSNSCLLQSSELQIPQKEARFLIVGRGKLYDQSGPMTVVKENAAVLTSILDNLQAGWDKLIEYVSGRITRNRTPVLCGAFLCPDPSVRQWFLSCFFRNQRTALHRSGKMDAAVTFVGIAHLNGAHPGRYRALQA